jgi:hypothetical protein
MSRQMSWIFAIALAAGVAGCAPYPTITTQTVIVAGVGPVEVEQLNVEVVDVNPAERVVLVRQGGRSWHVMVPESFGNLRNIQPGDKVEIRRVEGAVLGARRARKGARPGIVYTEAVSGPPFQNLPDKFVVRSLTVTAQFQAFDPTTSVVNYVGPLGPRSLTVVDPEIKQDLRRLRRGDMVELTLAEAFYFQKY